MSRHLLLPTSTMLLGLLLLLSAISSHFKTSSVLVVDAVCASTGRPGDKLDPYIDPATGNISCLPGFLCNGFDVNNVTTYPEYCVPDPECQVTRLFGGTCDNRQGTFEPEICPQGYYCPINTGNKIKCPSNTFCPVGSTEPRPCPAVSICDGRQITYLPAVIAFVVITVALVLGVFIYRRMFLSSTLTYAEDSGRMTPTPGGTSRDVSDQQLVDGFRRSRANRPPLRLEFSNLAVSVEDKATGKEKSILKDMSGFMEPGTVTAIMGPSGAGKTTFMMALLGKKDSAWKTKGKLLVNGEDNLSNIRHSIGFVPQDDVLHNELSVYKNLYYSSETRLPRSWTSDQKAAFRSAVIESLGLTNQRDIVIGDDRERGVSGGQRKRASIGVELTAAPLAMFLDEPTSGLDSTTSLEVCTTLKKIAVETDLTVGMVIHQPRVEIWNGLDQVLFIGKGGRVVYQGSQADAQKYFETKCGIEFPTKANPADVIIDVMDQQDSDKLADLWKAHIESTSPTLGKGSSAPKAIAYDAVPEPFGQSDSGFRGANVFKQIFLAHNRYVEKQLATLYALRVEMVVGILCGAILGQGFRDDNPYTGFYIQPYRRISIQPITALFPQLNMYAVMSIGLGAAPGGVRIFGLDRANYFREVAAGANPVAYFLGTLLSSVYRCLYVSLLFSVGYHVVGGIPIGFGHFFSAMFLVYWNAYAVGMVVSMFVSMRLAPLVAQVVVVCTAMFNGFVAYPHFLKLIAFSFHASQVLMNQWHELYKHVYEPQFEEWGYTGDRESQSLGIMFVISMVVQAIALILMVVLDRERQR